MFPYICKQCLAANLTTIYIINALCSMMILFAILTLIYRAVWYITKYTQLELYNFAGRAWVLTCWWFIVKKKK